MSSDDYHKMLMEHNSREAKKRFKTKTKNETFKKFSIWLTLPPQLLGMNTIDLEKSGVSNPLYYELISIKTRADFSRLYGVSQKTLVLWSKEISTVESDSYMYKFFFEFTRTLLMAFYRSQLKRPTPQGIRTWYEIVKGWRKDASYIPTHADELSEEEKDEIRSIIRLAKTPERSI